MASAALKELRRRQAPPWWREAKLGIMVHWTPASVPGFAPTEQDLLGVLTSRAQSPYACMPYTEWYENSLRFAGSPAWRFHHQQFAGRPYASFGGDLDAAAEQWDPRRWARQFAASGARYVVMVAKHADGFCLWPSAVVNPNRAGWHTRRDVVGELGEAVRAEGLRFGIYYSGGFDSTFDDRPIATTAGAALAVPRGAYPVYAAAQVRELVDRYQPSVLWNDIAWPQRAAELWPLLHDYYAKVPDGVVNDRFLPWSPTFAWLRSGTVRRLADSYLRRAAARQGGLVPPKPPHFDYRTVEYSVMSRRPPWPWECVRGMDRSFGFNRRSRPEHFLSRDELLGTLSAVNANGGNLLLNVGPRGDSTIPKEQLLRLSWLGEAVRRTGRSG